MSANKAGLAFRPAHLFLFLPVALLSSAATPSLDTLKHEAREIVRANATLTQQMVDSIFSISELGFQEFETSAYVTGILEKEGFSVTRAIPPSSRRTWSSSASATRPFTDTWHLEPARATAPSG